jgi:hypothetical protein
MKTQSLPLVNYVLFVTVTRMSVCVQSALMQYGMVNSKRHNKEGWNKHSRMITLMSSHKNTFINGTKVL